MFVARSIHGEAFPIKVPCEASFNGIARRHAKTTAVTLNVIASSSSG
jgi:hypothetical protein